MAPATRRRKTTSLSPPGIPSQRLVRARQPLLVLRGRPPPELAPPPLPEEHLLQIRILDQAQPARIGERRGVDGPTQVGGVDRIDPLGRQPSGERGDLADAVVVERGIERLRRAWHHVGRASVPDEQHLARRRGESVESERGWETAPVASTGGTVPVAPVRAPAAT